VTPGASTDWFEANIDTDGVPELKPTLTVVTEASDLTAPFMRIVMASPIFFCRLFESPR
jgi:hypothetical protein